MAMTINEAAIIPAGTAIPFGAYTEDAPHANGRGAEVGPFTDYANTFAYRITNGATAPGSPVTVVFYAIGGNGRLYEVDRVTGDAVANSKYSGLIPCPAGFAKFTAKAFGNTSQDVMVEVFLGRQVP